MSNWQFGFKSKVSCNHAIYAVRKTIDFFVESGSTANVAAIDLKKAFDKMNKYALFIKLLQRNCPITFIILLDCWFSKVFASVKWGSCMSSIVRLTSSICQGGVLPPTLFAGLINDVLVKLEKFGLVCFIHNLSFNAFMYADDILLLSISVEDLQKMLNICNDELISLDMSVNTNKSSCIRVGKNILHL